MTPSDPEITGTGGTAYRDPTKGDTGRNPKYASAEENRRSGAAAFDTLALTNLKLVATLNRGLVAMTVCGVCVVLMMGTSVFMLRAGQVETRELLIAISKRPRLCSEVKKEVSE